MLSIRKFNITFYIFRVCFLFYTFADGLWGYYAESFSYSLQEIDKIGGYILEIVGTFGLGYGLAVGAGLFTLDFV